MTLAGIPAGKFCTVANGKGAFTDASVTNIAITCGARTFSTLYTAGATGDNGILPQGLSQGWNGALYVNMKSGGARNMGALLQVATTGEAELVHSFEGVSAPVGNIIQGRDGSTYGVTSAGGDNGAGVVFQLTREGALNTLFSFPAQPTSPLKASTGLMLGWDGSIHGSAPFSGEANDAGMAYKIGTDGKMTISHAFSQLKLDEGRHPLTKMTQAWDGIYGTTAYGGASDLGTAYKIAADGTLSTLYAFTGKTDGKRPSALATGPDGHFYGVSAGGGAYSHGAIFQLTRAGQFELVYSFKGTDGTPVKDGANDYPLQSLLLTSSGNFYGTNIVGGSGGYGTVYELTPAGTFTVIHAFTGGADGAYPTGELIEARNGVIYGVTTEGGSNKSGTVFQIAPK